MNRKLEKEYINDLKGGVLAPILNTIKNDNTLDLQIRTNYINIYYRGGNLLKIEKKNDKYKVIFDQNYSKDYLGLPVHDLSLISNCLLTSENDSFELVKKIPLIKQAMDYFFVNSVTKNEREFQQLIVRENNYLGTSVSLSTDYYICDIEYKESSSQYDMLAINWESNGIKRKNNENLDISLIEVKYGDNALSGHSGIVDHLEKANTYCEDKNIKILKEDMKNMFNQKMELGLINCSKEIESFSNVVPDFIFILINHDPDKRKLKEELDRIKTENYPNINIKFALANFMGYGLYKQNILTLEDFKNKYLTQIYSK